MGLCVSSRALTAIYYIEDTDSLRFALSIVDYDVAKLQPHFPAYPVFCWAAKILYIVTERFALAFAFLGGLATFITSYYLIQISRTAISHPFGWGLAALIFFNPLLWLMGNRYMPDLFGLGCLFASLYYLTCHKQVYKVGLGFFLAGIMLGIRLSYSPFLLVPLLLCLKRPGPRLYFIFAGVLGALVWFIPLVINTGWDTLILAAQHQSQGHFNEFGGTILTESDYSLRLRNLFEKIWADGLGFYWPGRSWVTLGSACTLILLIVYHWRIWVPYVHLRLVYNEVVIGCLVYLVWVFFFQNILYKSRHILPVLPLILIFIARLFSHIMRRRAQWSKVFFVLFAGCYIYVGLYLVIQHKSPTAIAQIQQHLSTQKKNNLHIASVPLIKYYLASQGIDAVYYPVEHKNDLTTIAGLDKAVDLVVIDMPLEHRVAKSTKTFFHNPYVNQMWPSLTVYHY